ncbi:hypothetical protein [Pontibacter pudoricolor]|uniref:hypothetical protein n=1 Tax=Pontibacter pudoricolor TaxID=2694930 RepID=UPI001391BCE2|nr:hypothetical protein [Pontibacter pudoricolor]
MKNITRHISLALTIGISVLTTDLALAQQGKGHKKEEEQTTQQKGRADQDKEKEHSNRPANPRERAAKRRAEAKANAQHNKAEEKSAKGNNGKDKANNGNAYGKNKGELSGREFGQARAAAARLSNEEKQEKLNKVVTEGDEKVTEARGRVARALEELERNRKANTISDAEYNERKAKITRVEKAIQVLEEKVRDGKQLVITIE